MISSPFAVLPFGRVEGVGVDGRLTGSDSFLFSLRAGACFSGREEEKKTFFTLNGSDAHLDYTPRYTNALPWSFSILVQGRLISLVQYSPRHPLHRGRRGPQTWLTSIPANVIFP